jgi:molecular chaperone HtpG
VDSSDLSLNISRETLQHDRQLKVIAKAIEKKVKSELEKMMSADREAYEKFFDSFGIQLKYGIYTDYGMHKDVLQDLILFASSREGKMISFKEYVASMKEEQKTIYYACGETVDQIAMLPQVEAVRDHGMEVLYFTDDALFIHFKRFGVSVTKHRPDRTLAIAPQLENLRTRNKVVIICIAHPFMRSVHNMRLGV